MVHLHRHDCALHSLLRLCASAEKGSVARSLTNLLPLLEGAELVYLPQLPYSYILEVFIRLYFFGLYFPDFCLELTLET